MYHDRVTQPLRLELDRSAKTPLAEEIRKGISAAIEGGVLAPGAVCQPDWTWQPITDASGPLHTPSTALQIAGAAQPQQFGR
jgi:hypothetical protein